MYGSAGLLAYPPRVGSLSDYSSYTAGQSYMPSFATESTSAFYSPLTTENSEPWRSISQGSGGTWPYETPMSTYPYGPSYGGLDVRRKNATRESTSTLKAWLYEHIKNPYPTKGEKIMLAIITKMTLTQVSTWFANARRRLKKENKMQWSPRNRTDNDDEDRSCSEDEDDEGKDKLSGESAKSQDGKEENEEIVVDSAATDDVIHKAPDCSLQGMTSRYKHNTEESRDIGHSRSPHSFNPDFLANPARGLSTEAPFYFPSSYRGISGQLLSLHKPPTNSQMMTSGCQVTYNRPNSLTDDSQDNVVDDDDDDHEDGDKPRIWSLADVATSRQSQRPGMTGIERPAGMSYMGGGGMGGSGYSGSFGQGLHIWGSGSENSNRSASNGFCHEGDSNPRYVPPGYPHRVPGSNLTPVQGIGGGTPGFSAFGGSGQSGGFQGGGFLQKRPVNGVGGQFSSHSGGSMMSDFCAMSAQLNGMNNELGGTISSQINGMTSPFGGMTSSLCMGSDSGNGQGGRLSTLQDNITSLQMGSCGLSAPGSFTCPLPGGSGLIPGLGNEGLTSKRSSLGGETGADCNQFSLSSDLYSNSDSETTSHNMEPNRQESLNNLDEDKIGGKLTDMGHNKTDLIFPSTNQNSFYTAFKPFPKSAFAFSQKDPENGPLMKSKITLKTNLKQKLINNSLNM